MDVSGHPITIRRVQDSDTVYIHGGESQPCFELLLDDEAVLSSVKRQIGCFMDDNPESRDIVRAAYKVAQMYGARTLTLTDNSSIHCPETVLLSDLSFLTTGKTWYESILPLECRSFTREALEKYRERALSNTWRAVGDGMLDIEITGVDIEEPGSAAHVLGAMKQARSFCTFLHTEMAELLVRSRIPTMYGTEWWCTVMPDRRRSRKRPFILRKNDTRTKRRP